jgi:hypothetical protein
MFLWKECREERYWFQACNAKMKGRFFLLSQEESDSLKKNIQRVKRLDQTWNTEYSWWPTCDCPGEESIPSYEFVQQLSLQEKELVSKMVPLRKDAARLALRWISMKESIEVECELNREYFQENVLDDLPSGLIKMWLRTIFPKELGKMIDTYMGHHRGLQ